MAKPMEMTPPGQTGEDLKTKEGKAIITSPPTVFYNPVQEFNRDLTIAVVRQFAREHLEAKVRQNSNQGDHQDDQQQEEGGDEPAAKMARTDVNNSSLDEKDAEMSEATEPINTGPASSLNLDLQPGKVYENGIRILEGLAATGLRSVRFALEVAGIKEVIANDYSQAAVEYIEKNIAENDVKLLVKASYADAAMLMYQNRRVSERYDVVDIDPYGSPSPFIDAAVQAVSDGGLLCVTSTDLATMCGNFPETCHSKYGAVAVRGKFCHEKALRILLQSIEASANRYSRYIVPLISVSADFYIRMFMKVYSGQAKVKESITKLSMVYVCCGCGTFHLQPLGIKHKARSGNEEDSNFKFTAAQGPPVTELCEHCGFKHHLAGPIWTSKIHDVDFVKKVLTSVGQSQELGTRQRILGMLSVISEELPDVPLYYVTDELCKMMHCTPPTQLQIRSAIMNACYSVSLSHAAKNSIKTTAPMAVIWDILRCWVNKTTSGTSNRIKEGSVAFALRAKEPSIIANFTPRQDANPLSKKAKLKRFQLNPEADWGPKAKAGGKEGLDERREKGILKAQLKPRKPKDLKRFACKKFKAGKCKLGDSCRYNHKVGPVPAEANVPREDEQAASYTMEQSMDDTGGSATTFDESGSEPVQQQQQQQQTQDNLYTSF